MLLLADVLLLVLLIRAEQPVCRPHGTKELAEFTREGDVTIGGTFSFHQNPLSVNPTLQANPGNIGCEG